MSPIVLEFNTSVYLDNNKQLSNIMQFKLICSSNRTVQYVQECTVKHTIKYKLNQKVEKLFSLQNIAILYS